MFSVAQLRRGVPQGGPRVWEIMSGALGIDVLGFFPNFFRSGRCFQSSLDINYPSVSIEWELMSRAPRNNAPHLFQRPSRQDGISKTSPKLRSHPLSPRTSPVTVLPPIPPIPSRLAQVLCDSPMLPLGSLARTGTPGRQAQNYSMIFPLFWEGQVGTNDPPTHVETPGGNELEELKELEV